MNGERKMKAVYAGSFDPVTNGHINIIKRSARLFDQVIVAIATNAAKDALFTLEEKQQLLQSVMMAYKIDNVTIMPMSQGLTVDFAQQQRADILIRGIRSTSDVDYEMAIESMNKLQNNHIETLFLMADPHYRHISSSMVKEIAKSGGRLDQLVPKQVACMLVNKLIR